MPVAVALAAGCLSHRSPPLQLQENRGVYNYIPLAVHLFIRSNVLGLERMFEQEPPQQQKAERNANRLRARQRWKPRAGVTHAASPSRASKPSLPRGLAAFLPFPLLILPPARRAERCALLGGLEAVSRD